MKYEIMFDVFFWNKNREAEEWEGELNFQDILDIEKKGDILVADFKEADKYLLISKKEAKRFMNNCPLISVNEEN